MKNLPILAFASGLALAGGALLPSPARAQDECATQAKKRRPSLFGAEGAGGLLRRVEGVVRGDRNLGKDIGDTARTAASQRASEATSTAACRATRPKAQKDAEATPPPSDAHRPSETSTERAARRQAESDKQYPSRMEIPQEWRTAKDAYTEFGKVRCTGCEGGFAYSGWPSWPRDEFDGKQNGSDTRLSRLPIGHVHRWNANGFAGSLSIDSEETVNGFRCRRMTYRLAKDGKSVERPGLMCWGKSSQFSANDGWVSVF